MQQIQVSLDHSTDSLVSIIADAFEDLSHSLRVLLESDFRAHRGGLLQIDRAEAVGNIETALGSVLNAFHSIYDAVSKDPSARPVDWYAVPELATILTLRNARHHNHAKKVRTIYTFYVQEAARIGAMERYVLVDFPSSEQGGDTFDVYLAWADLKLLLELPAAVSRIKGGVAHAIRAYLGADRFQLYSESYGLGEDRVFFNVVPLIVEAAIKVIPQIGHLLEPKSTESKTYLFLFKDMPPADMLDHEVNCGPFALMP